MSQQLIGRMLYRIKVDFATDYQITGRDRVQPQLKMHSWTLYGWTYDFVFVVTKFAI